jgi:hypothetical protein
MSATLKQKEINRLLHNTPSPAHADAKSRLAEFVLVADQFDLKYLQLGVSQILNSEAEGVDPKFAIFPPILAKVCRQLRDRDIEFEMTRRRAVLQIEDRSKEFHKDPPDVRRAAVAAGLARLSGLNKPEETPEQVKEREAATARHLAKHDSYFALDHSGEATRRRLKI